MSTQKHLTMDAMQFKNLNFLKVFLLLALLLLCLPWTIPIALSAPEIDVTLKTGTQDIFPKIFLAPWETTNVDSDAVAANRTTLISSHKKLAEELGIGQLTLSTYMKESTPDQYATNSLLVQSPAFTSTYVSMQQQISGKSIMVIPVWTKFKKKNIVILTKIDAITNEILGMDHEVLSEINEEEPSSSQIKSTNTATIKQQRTQAQKMLSTNSIQNALIRINALLSSQNSLTSPPDLAVSIANISSSDRKNEFDRSTLNILLAMEHLKGFRVVNPYSQELIAKIHHVFGLKAQFRKANRNLTTIWSFSNKDLMQQNALQIRARLLIRPSDGVFGQSLPWQVDEDVDIIAKPNNKLSLNLSNKLSESLDVEKKSLNRAENPAASKIYGAWVYLDKGRAWGLRMNDRLIISDGTTEIKGHIVSYYGPEQKLSSPRGWPVNEGAIMFIRKGQDKVKVGQEFIYDKMLVPTHWPNENSSVK